MSAPYSTLKAAWHTDRIEAMRRGEQAVPISMQLIISDLCNHDCHWCAYRASNGLSSELFGGIDKKGLPTMNPNRMIETAKVKEIVEDAATLGIRSITWTGGGEPTVHPDHLELFQYALDRGIECSMNSNGNLLRPGWESVLPRFTYIRFSIDGGTAAEYARDRRVSLKTYDKVLHNLERLVAEVARQKSPCTVGTGYVVTPTNYMNLLRGVERLRDTGAAYVRLASMQTTDGPELTYGDKLEEARGFVREAIKLSTPTFNVVDLFDSAMGRPMADPFCGFQELVMYIGADLHVARCCYVAYTKLGVAGNISDKRLIDWFHSEEKKKSYAEFDARSCSVCPLADKNDTITYMIRKPTHVNFV